MILVMMFVCMEIQTQKISILETIKNNSISTCWKISWKMDKKEKTEQAREP